MMRAVFMGSPAFAVPALERLLEVCDVALVVSQPDKPAGRGRKLMAPAIKTFAEARGIPVLQPKSARKAPFVQALREVGADIGVVVAYGKILPAAVLDVFPHGCLNIHGSLLPDYRGAAPIQRAIMEGCTETGISLMKLDEGMDTGPVYATRTVQIEDNDTTGTMSEQLSVVGADLLVEVVSAIEAGTAVATPQPDGGSHAAMLDKREGEVAWNLSAREVSCRVRGVDPWPAAFSFAGGRRFRLFSPTVCEGTGNPGQVLSADDGGVVVACGEAACRFAVLQPDGKRRMSAGDVVRGRTLEVGATFGPAGTL